MKTSVTLDEGLVKRFKVAVAARGMTMREGMEEAVGNWVEGLGTAHRPESRRGPAAGDLGVGERPAAAGPKRERRDARSAGRVAHEQGARGETNGPEEGETPGPGSETTEPASETKPAGGETGAPRVRRCTRHGKRVWVEGLVKLATDCVDPRCREEAGLA